MKKLAGNVCLLLILVAGICQAQDKKDQNSLLWEISGKGMSKPSYLYGTMHVSNKLAFNFQDTFYVALKGVEVVALELNPDSFLVNLINSGSANFNSLIYNKYLSYGEKDFYHNFTAQGRPTMDFYRQALASNDMLLNNLLFRTRSAEEQYEEQTYLDLFIFQAAKKLRKEVTNLEDFEISEKYSLLAMMPDKDENKFRFDEQYLKQYQLASQLENAYRTADLALIDSITRMTSYSKNYYHYFIVERNRMMMQTIDSVINVGQAIFAACGVAHLPGDSGIIEMLRAEGYTLRPVKTAITEQSHRSRQEIEKMIVSPKMIQYVADDSSFSVNVPGRMHNVPVLPGSTRYIYPDMTNGGFFQVSHYNTYGRLDGLDRAFYCRQIDSILYEVTPGDILKKSFTQTKGAYAFYDVTSRVSVDNSMRFRIYVGDFDIYVFKLYGMEDYVKSKFTADFFNSIVVKERTGTGYRNMDIPRAGLRVRLPDNVWIQNNIDKDYTRKVKGNVDVQIQAVDPAKQRYFLFTAASLFDADYLEEDSFELHYLAKCMMDERPYKCIRKEDFSDNGIPGANFTYTDSLGQYVFIQTRTHGSQYVLMLVQQPDSIFPGDYFNSLEFTDYQYSEDFTPYADKDLFFKVNTTSFLGVLKSGMLVEMIRLLEEWIKAAGEDDDYFSLFSGRELDISSGMSPESASVNLDLFPPYDSFEDLDDFKTRLKKKVITTPGFIVRDEQYQCLGDSIHLFTFITGDTNTTKTIHSKVFLKGGAFYQLRLVGHQGVLNGAWSNEVFNSFMPCDTTMGSNPFGSKHALFIEHLQGDDSVLNKQALRYSETLMPDSSLTGQIATFISTDKFRQLKVHQRCSLIELMADTLNQSVLPLLDSLYLAAGDTAELQFSVLEVLLAKETPASLELFRNLILKDPPIVEYSYSIDQLFVQLDSLRYPMSLFPEILSLTRYQDYREPLYELLAQLVREKLIEPAIYKTYINDILTDAQEDYKRTFSRKGNYMNEDDDQYMLDLFADYSSTGIQNVYENDFITLLLPFEKEESVKKYLDKIRDSQLDELIFPLLIEQIRTGRPYVDSLVQHFSKADRSIVSFYNALQKVHHPEIFDTSYFKQEVFARAAAFNGKRTPDEILLLEKRLIKIGDTTGYIYFFKYRQKYDSTWKLMYSGPQPADGQGVDTDTPFFGKGKSIDDDKQLAKMILDIMDELSLRNRKRVQFSQDFWGYGDWDY